MWSRVNENGDESVGDGDAADDTIRNFFQYDECDSTLEFTVSSAETDLASLTSGSFSKPRSSYFGKAKNPINNVFTRRLAPVHFRRHVESGRFMFLYLIVASSCRLMAVFAPVANVPPHPGDLQWGARSLLILASTDRASSPFSGLRNSSAATTSSTSLDGQINHLSPLCRVLVTIKHSSILLVDSVSLI